MAKDFSITADDRDKTMDRVAREERELMAEMERQERLNAPGANKSDPDNFNFRADAPLPEGFVNPPCGEDGHFCVDQRGFYQPDWFALQIDKVYSRQQNPQPFNCGGSRYLVPLETWVDAPAGVVEALKSAIEEHHEYEAKPGDILLGIPTRHIVRRRKRFHWNSVPSAKVRMK